MQKLPFFLILIVYSVSIGMEKDQPTPPKEKRSFFGFFKREKNQNSQKREKKNAHLCRN